MQPIACVISSFYRDLQSQSHGSLSQGSFAKETYHLKESTTWSHPIEPIAFGVSFLQYQLSINNLVL